MYRAHLSSLAFVLLLAGCGTPASMHVRLGGEPHHQDDDVLFRTTYYFRVFDFCEEGGDKRIKSDSLYRFKMTGKGKSAFNKVHFESGTLRAWQIDPFGAAIEFDPKTGKPYFLSQQKREEVRQQEQLYEEVNRLRDLAQKIGCPVKNDDTRAEQCRILDGKVQDALRMIGPNGVPNVVAAQGMKAAGILNGLLGSSTDQNKPSNNGQGQVPKDLTDIREQMLRARHLWELTDAIDKVLSLLGDSTKAAQLNAGKSQQAKNELENIKKDLMASAGLQLQPTTEQKTLICGDGRPARRGFQVLGPEGWRTFDQDERLVLAMSSSARPLLESLRELADRALAHRAAPLSSEQLLQASLAASRARLAVVAVETASEQELENRLGAVVSAFTTQAGR